MIYLIITTSINNKYTSEESNERKERYINSIRDTLSNLPVSVKPIIVENNGVRSTYLDNFFHNNNKVTVIYTDNNKRTFKNKGINEFLDIKDVITQCMIGDDDMIIKLTGRYRFTSSEFFQEVIENKDNCDAFIKFFGSCTIKFETYDCILGSFAMRAKYLKLFNPMTIENYKSSEIAFSRYVRFSILNYKEMMKLDLECKFAEDGRIITV